MRLYATVTSERASKGQGGNKYLDIDIFTTSKENATHRIKAVYNDDGMITVSFTAIFFGGEKTLAIDTIYTDVPIKGERQKGEKRCDFCGNTKEEFPCDRHNA